MCLRDWETCGTSSERGADFGIYRDWCWSIAKFEVRAPLPNNIQDPTTSQFDNVGRSDLDEKAVIALYHTIK